jgi:hypothetical protein
MNLKTFQEMHHTDSLIGGFHGDTLPTVLVNNAEEVMDIIEWVRP